ncbi:isoprenoid synthase domain-containing protein [Chaetomium tenue]|uniref:Isoprenoid synthase domain-containing protein n=1 Tax=Chaetomium tenue TaxID=1854479 RepID=A0ACB7PKK5_9PEZI|nr:isoprenoid synthase domain-containing protein [Chaetomium globosum]
MSSPASTPDARPHHRPGYLTFGKRIDCNTPRRRPIPSRTHMHMLHFRRPPRKEQPVPTAMAAQNPPSSSSTATGSNPNHNQINGHSNAFLQSPAAIPPRTSSTNSTLPSALRSVPEGDWFPGSAVPGHRRQRSRKTSVGTTTFPSTTMSAPPAPPDPNRFATEDFFQNRRTWSEEKDKVLTGPFDYLNGHPGKDFRSALVKAFDAWLEVPPESLEVITKVVGMLHTASLLVDDVEDNSQLRRGYPVAHTIFGIPQTINSSNYIYFCALQELQKLKNPKAVSIFAEELVNLHRGQGMDLFWRDTLTCPTEDDYLEMVSNKTGGLFRLGIKLMQAESRSLVDCVPLVNIVGLVFQIADDFHNLFSKEYTANKGMCEDLTEGKFSFPVIHSIRSNMGDMQLLNILRQKTENEEIKRYAVSYMESTGSFAYTRKVLDVLIERARRMTDEVDDGRGKGEGIHRILDRMVIKD